MQRQDCYQLPHGEVQACLNKVNSIGYQQYRRERKEMQEDDAATEQAQSP
jgi:hypothetical protein